MPQRFHLSSRALRAAVAALAAFALPVSSAGPSAAAPGPAISEEYFGLHHAGLHAPGPIGWPQTQVASIRMWDNGVTWRELETSPGVFRWDRIDAQMAKAREAGASVLLVLGQTPRFHASQKRVAGSYGRGAPTMPKSKAVWTRYVKAVAQRNLSVWGGIADFQVWNEANVLPYWAGTPRQMATLTRWTQAAVRSVDRTATVVSPAMVTRLTSQRSWIRTYYKQRLGGRNVSAYSDVLAFHLYPEADGSPERSMELLAWVRSTLRRYGINKPIWNTEVNYGLIGGPNAGAPARRISAAKQQGNVVRTYVLNAQNGVRRVYWYSWDLLKMANTSLVEDDRITLTASGRAYERTRDWLLGTRPAGCNTTGNGTYVCAFRADSEVRRVVWNPKRKVTYRTPAGTRAFQSVRSGSISFGPGQGISVGPSPVLLRATR